MELKVSERRKINITVPSLGKTLEFRKPTLGEFGAYEEALEAAKAGGSVHKAMVDFLVSIGATKEDAMALDNEEYGEIVTFVMGSKKN